MVERSEITQRIDLRLIDITAEVDDLPYLATIWEKESEIIRGDREIEWAELMDRLWALEQNYLRGEMTVDQATRYRELLTKLKKSLPIIRQLELEEPSVSLELETEAA